MEVDAVWLEYKYDLLVELLQKRPKAPTSIELARWDTATLEEWLKSHREWEAQVNKVANQIATHDEEESND